MVLVHPHVTNVVQKTHDLEEDLMLTQQNYPTCWEISVHILGQTGV